MPCDRAIDLQFPGQPIWAQRVYEIPASVPSTELNPTLRSVDTHGPLRVSLISDMVFGMREHHRSEPTRRADAPWLILPMPVRQDRVVREPQSELRSSGGSPSIGRVFCFSDGSYLTRCAFLKVTSVSLG